MGLSVAVVLGFNIGGGNIRDRLASGQTQLRVQCMQCPPYQIVLIVNTYKTFLHL